jgi:hypothetical protein
MRKAIVIFLSGFLLFPVAGKSIELNITASETNALVQFLISCQHQNERSALYQLLMGSKYNTEQTKTMLKKWDQLEKHDMLNFEGFPESRHNGRSVSDLVVIQSVRAKNARELAQNCMGYFTQSELKKFREILLYFEPIYHELVWLPNLKKTNAKLKEVRAFVQQKNIRQMFNQAAAFYGTKWEDDFPFYVMVNPLPGRVQYTSARPMGQVLIADLVLNEKDLSGWLGVVFHEMCHVLYNNQPREKQDQLEKLFTTHSEVNYRLPAYNWFNETMATALGNGWLVEKITGHLDSTEWYNNSYINRFAHVVYPLVKQYADAGKTMDSELVNACIASFKKEFEKINTETEHLFTFINLVADTMPQENYNDIFRFFYPRSLSCETPFEGDHLERVEAGVSTKVFVITSEKQEKLKLLETRFGFTDLQVSDKSCIYYFLERNGANYFILALNNIGDLAKACESLSKQKELKENKGVLFLEE